jgi:hypothetical protein
MNADRVSTSATGSSKPKSAGSVGSNCTLYVG